MDYREMLDRKGIAIVAKNFRRAIDAAKADGKFNWEYERFHKDRMINFPSGCCDDICDLFWHYLSTEHHIRLQQISAFSSNGDSYHNWLETMNGLIIDLTGDQFAGRRVMYAEPDDGFYRQMRGRKEISPYSIFNCGRLKRDYEVIMEYMR